MNLELTPPRPTRLGRGGGKTAKVSLRLTAQQQANLRTIAERTQSLAWAGPTYGSPSWRALVRRIANGELLVIESSQQ